MPQADLVATCSRFRHTSAEEKAKVKERKQDALRGVESPLIFMVRSWGPTQGPFASTPDVAKPSKAALPDHGASVAVASTALVHHLACLCPHPRRPDDTQTTTPDRGGTF